MTAASGVESAVHVLLMGAAAAPAGGRTSGARRFTARQESPTLESLPLQQALLLEAVRGIGHASWPDAAGHPPREATSAA